MDFVGRRARLLAALERPALLFAGGHLGRNYPQNFYPYRADSSFLYFFERPEPGSAALFDPDAGRVTLFFLPERTVEDALWHGPVASFDEARASQRVDEVRAVESLEVHVAQIAAGRSIDALAVSDPHATARARAITSQDLRFEEPERLGAPSLRESIARLRLAKDADEIAEMRRTAEVTRAAHVAAMRASRPGVTEERLAGLVEGAFALAGCVPAYGTILSARGEVLHNHSHAGTLEGGDVVLCDAGAEARSGYCSDVTRCWPVGQASRSAPEWRDVYDLVLAANERAIAMAQPGARYRDVHLGSARVIAEGLVAMGLLAGTVDSLVESGAHAVFFPHGVGHPIGLDVHDLEAFGDRVLYPGRTRSTQFGTGYLRMDMDLAPGHTFTIEPGVYFVPAILRSPKLRETFGASVRWEAAERFLAMNGGRGFGGVRIEDDVLCTPAGADVLTRAIPKSRAEIEALAGRDASG